MSLPGIPSTNNTWIIFVVFGCILIYNLVYKVTDYFSLQRNFLESSELTLYEIEKKSKERTLIFNKVDSIKKLNSSFPNDSLYLNIKIKLLKETTDELTEHEAKFDSLIQSYEVSEVKYKNEKTFLVHDLLGSIFLGIVGLVLIIFGINKLQKNQTIRDAVLYSDYLKLKVRDPFCQSCGMDLRYDNKFDNNSNYCSFCFDGKKFNHVNIEIQEFRNLIEKQLIIKGFTVKQRKSKLKEVNKLGRWIQKFDWES
ncbi:zinc ribbon domain-containing protein [Aquimarina sp. AU474]|uniref:zinc ribbon domain-containing protein n=1 Tax=Aquimarina sp. AU474 TaxID=2108529 RepID=UPI000D69F350|nr:zinc ribbon domain-containing protein [Aquimarina sp. AU474]